MHAACDYDFRTGKRLGKKDHMAKWTRPAKPEWMTKEEYDNYPKEMLIREVEIEKKRNSHRTKKCGMVQSRVTC